MNTAWRKLTGGLEIQAGRYRKSAIFPLQRVRRLIVEQDRHLALKILPLQTVGGGAAVWCLSMSEQAEQGAVYKFRGAFANVQNYLKNKVSK